MCWSPLGTVGRFVGSGVGAAEAGHVKTSVSAGADT